MCLKAALPIVCIGEMQCPAVRPVLGQTMPASVLPLEQTAPHLPPRGALIGLALGTKTIGVAASDPDRRLATGIETIARQTFTADAKRVLALTTERRGVGFVLGLPINMDG